MATTIGSANPAATQASDVELAVFIPEIWADAVRASFKKSLVMGNLAVDYSSLLTGGGDITNTYNILDGYLYVNFDFEFSEADKFRIKILEENNIVYRGKLIATSEETQNFLADNNEYYYE